MAPLPVPRTLVFDGTGLELVLRTGPGEIALYLPERYVVLSQVRASSGVRYEEEGILLWMKGDEAMLEVDGVRYADCRRHPLREPWVDAARRGVNFRAVGNEPGWHLEIRAGRELSMITDYGQRRVEAPLPEKVTSGQPRSYHAITDVHDLRVEIENLPCLDSMSGEHFGASVTVHLDGKRYHGCGRVLY